MNKREQAVHMDNASRSAALSYQTQLTHHKLWLLVGLGSVGLVGQLFGIYASLGGSLLHILLPVGGTLISISALLLTYKKSYLVAERCLVALLIVAAYQLALSDPTGNYGLFLFFAVPAISFFLLGRREGLVWSLGILVSILLAIILAAGLGVHLPYGNDALRDFSISLIATSILFYLQEDLLTTSGEIITKHDRLLALKRDQLEAIVAAIGEGIFVISHDYRIVQVNQMACSLLKLTETQLLGRPIYDVIRFTQIGRADHLDPVASCFTRQQKIIINLQDSYLLQAQNNVHFPVSFTVSPLQHHSNSTGAVLVFRDSSEDKAAAIIIEQQVVEKTREVRKEWARILASIEGLITPFLMTDNQLNTVVKNQAMERLLKRQNIDQTDSVASIQQLLGDAFPIEKAAKYVMESGQSFTQDEIAVYPLFLQIAISPICFKDRVIGTVILIEDITDRKVTESSKSHFFSHIVQELQKPIQTMEELSAALGQALTQHNDPAELKKLANINQEVQRLKKIHHDFSDVVTLEHGKLALSKKPVDVADCIADITAELGPSASAKGLTLNAERSPENVRVIADQQWVKHILRCLVTNSISYTATGSISFNVQVDDNVRISVTDTGKGIPLRNQSLLFRKLQQASDSLLTREIARGTGLSLYMSRLVAIQMGGDLYLEHSEEGKGSTFTLVLPKP
jgi:signal transduction histidine kinase